MQTILDGIVQHAVTTDRLTANVLERPGNKPAKTAVFIHGNVSGALFWQPVMLALPESVRGLAIDLRGFGGSDTLPVDSTRGLGDFSDDVLSVLQALQVDDAHLVGWSMGGGVVMQMLLENPQLVSGLTLVAPVAPGFVSEAEGPVGAVNADDGDRRREQPSTSSSSENWPGFAPGLKGVLNTMAPQFFNVSAIVDLPEKPPILWIHGANDAIVSDTSSVDLNFLGQLAAIPGWPGTEVAPPQPMISQTRKVLADYRAAGGRTTELLLENCGHSPHLEHPVEFVEALTVHLNFG